VGAAIICCTVLISNNLLADDGSSSEQTGISLDAAVNQVRQQYTDGTVLNTKQDASENGKIYIIKMITSDSRVLHIRVDAQSGKIIE
jgi:uncharacterized membrane protein YkoI